jgi:NAD+ diphosphatase
MPFKTPSSFVSALEPTPPPGPRLYFLVHEDKLLVNAQAQLPFVDSPTRLGVSVEVEEFLGVLEGQACVLALLDPRAPLPQGGQLLGLRALLGQMRPELMSIAGRAVQIAQWERAHRFCGACGTPTERVAGQRAKRCPRCELLAFPRVTPAIIVAVEKGDQILLARGPHFPPGVHSCLAGFVDPGESAEEAVHREVYEEVGLRVRNVRYFDSQPWPFPHSLMLGFFAEYASGDICVDGKEIVSADFFRADSMPAMFPGKFSISQWLIGDFLSRQA